MNRQDAEQLLKKSLGKPDAKFRDGQWEAIDALVNERKRLLVVQRTGWGKSAVYFISTKILRDRGLGTTLIISPLLALMRNQVESASKLGVSAITLNSNISKGETKRLTSSILNNEVDCLLISPEKLANDKFREEVLVPIAQNIGLIVVDEAHCISDWGHDFRPDYCRIKNILRELPANVPVLGTTATANDRVTDDVRQQLGDVELIRGSLSRDSLSLQTISMASQAERLAWLAEQIPHFEYSGIVYVMTQRDAEVVANWLELQGIKAAAYHGGSDHKDFSEKGSYREHLESQLINNQLKVLVATCALGMGYDKPDLGFVIHFQAPASVVDYYQQVGRAGRAIDQSIGILLVGEDDAKIQEFFRSTAFPSEYAVNEILSALEDSDGLSKNELEKYVNLKQKSQIEHVLKYLNVQNPAPIIKDGSKWYRLPNHFELDHERIAYLTSLRELEWNELQAYAREKGCLMIFLRKALDDNTDEPCGKCANCVGKELVSTQVKEGTIQAANRYLKHAYLPIEPRKKIGARDFVEYQFETYKGCLIPELIHETGRSLCRWGDSGWGQVVKDGKQKGCFADELVEAVVEMLVEYWCPEHKPQWVTCVPSQNNPNLVPSFARRLAARLGIPFINCFEKIKNNHPQKLQNNTYHRCHNLDGAFQINGDVPKTPVLLVDDMVDSKWTMTVLSALLKHHGSGKIYPMALADSSNKGE